MNVCSYLVAMAMPMNILFHDFYRDARIQTIYAGSSEIMKEVIARGILGR